MIFLYFKCNDTNCQNCRLTAPGQDPSGLSGKHLPALAACYSYSALALGYSEFRLAGRAFIEVVCLPHFLLFYPASKSSRHNIFNIEVSFVFLPSFCDAS